MERRGEIFIVTREYFIDELKAPRFEGHMAKKIRKVTIKVTGEDPNFSIKGAKVTVVQINDTNKV